MPYGNTPTTGTQGALPTNQFPSSSVYPPNKGGNNPTHDFVTSESGPVTADDDGNKSAPAGVYIKDGGDIAQGLTTDTAVVGDNPGTLSAKLRGLSKIWFDIWDSVNHRIKVDGSGVTQPVSGSVSVSNLLGTQPVSGTIASTQSGTWTIQPGNTANTTAWKMDGSAVTQPVSGTFWQATQPVSNASLPLPTGAAIEAGHLATIDAHTPALGQVAMVSSSPVVIASDQSKLSTKAASGDFATGSIADIATLLTLSGTPTDANTVNSLIGRLTKIRDLLTATLTISGAVTTSGTVTEANSATIVTNTGRIPSVGQTTMSASQPVVVASDQSNLPANIKAVNGTAIAVGSAALPILTSAATGAVALWGTNPATTGIATDISIKWGGSGTTQVNHVEICNNTTINVNYELDAATTLGSDVLAPGQKIFLDIQTTAVHLQTASSQNVNGSSGGNIVVRGWL